MTINKSALPINKSFMTRYQYVVAINITSTQNNPFVPV